MRPYDRVFATVDLSAVAFNMQAMREHISDSVAIIGVVKTDGYGHGAVQVAKTIDPFVAGYAVATVDEAAILRRHGIKKPILILGPVHEMRYRELFDLDLRPPVFQTEKAKKLSRMAAESGKTLKIHIALDTGMSRIGMFPDEDAVREVADISRLPGLEIEGLFTHFSRADERDKTSSREQLSKYLSFVARLEASGVKIPLKHCSNSAGIIDLEEARLDAVRAGISIYGLYPSDEVEKSSVSLKPAMELKSFVSFVKEIGPGTAVSYGGTFTADREMIIATIPVGYGDGYPRNLSGKGSVLIGGRRAPILGRICMDQFMVDVSHIPGVREDAQVTLLGRDGEEEITMEELADLSGGFHYELPCVLGKRVPRVYLEEGRITETKDYFND